MSFQKKIYISAHKCGFTPQMEPFQTIQVGAEKASTKFANAHDDTGDNISAKNSNYCELTAQYWVWKNAPPTDVVGFCHYRRYFHDVITVQHTKYLRDSEIENFFASYNSDFIDTYLKDHDIILLKPFSYYHSIENTLSTIVQKDDLIILENAIREIHPDYLDTYRRFMNHNNKISSCNMFITSWEIFEEYSSWLFEVLEHAEKKIKLSDYQTPSRVYGFLGEALLNVFVTHNKLRPKKIPVLVFRDDVKNDSNIVFLLKEMRRSISFFFNKPPKNY